ncbi:hypothetical protein [Pseudomonas sp. Z13]|uniref:hypothetical protein n=1 Tax=Pseudomonas sp. Z13 TaxID=2983409 RepID=UPI003FA75DB5
MGFGAELVVPENRQGVDCAIVAGSGVLQDRVNHAWQEMTRHNLNIQSTLTGQARPAGEKLMTDGLKKNDHSGEPFFAVFLTLLRKKCYYFTHFDAFFVAVRDKHDATSTANVSKSTPAFTSARGAPEVCSALIRPSSREAASAIWASWSCDISHQRHSTISDIIGALKRGLCSSQTV